MIKAQGWMQWCQAKDQGKEFSKPDVVAQAWHPSYLRGWYRRMAKSTWTLE